MKLRHAAKIIYLIGAVLSIVGAAALFIVGIASFSVVNDPQAMQQIYAENDFSITYERFVRVMTTLSVYILIYGGLYIVDIVMGFVGFAINRDDKNPLVFNSICVALGTLSMMPLILLGGIFGVVSRTEKPAIKEDGH